MKLFNFLFFLTLQSLVIGQESISSKINFQNIGPTIMSGRVVDLAVNPSTPTEFYVAYASGGVWHTNNNGNSFIPIMDNAPTLNCGCLTVDWKSKTIWVGTGEVNSSRSSYAGIGILKSTDNGKNWINIGLPESHHVSKIWVNPDDNNEMVVGVLGHLYTKNTERGLYKTIDGGKTWKQNLFINDETGIIDLVVDDKNPNIMFAAAWDKMRAPSNFRGNGINSGIYKSNDRGNTWRKLDDKNGFPNNEGIGRIGLALYDENTIYAVIDNQNLQPNSKNKKQENANTALFETEIIGAEIYLSENGGENWKKTNTDFIKDFYYSYGYYFGDITVSKTNKNTIYVSGVPLLLSNNGGITFESISKENVHADHHVIWINPNNPNHLINGNDGGINISYDNGNHWIKCNNQQVGQFYSVNVDNKENYNVYGGLQDNGVWVGPNNYKHNYKWHQEGKYPYEFLMGGDGMQVQIDANNSDLIYTGFQFGNYYKIDRKNNKSEFITPKSINKDNPLRFNWQTPIYLSPHNNEIIYLGSHLLHRSMNQGESWEIISNDLTNGKTEGNIPFGTITTISESKYQFGLIAIGTDDGNIQLTQDSGITWNKINSQLPQNLWISRIIFSSFKKERIYVTLNGYRNDNFQSYVYVTNDLGKTWELISKGIKQSVNVIIEDTNYENILYVGTDNGLYISLDSGMNWEGYKNGIPNVAVHDLVIQKSSKDLIIATHGRSLYKTNLSLIYQSFDAIKANKNTLFKIANVEHSKHWGSKQYEWGDSILPNLEIVYYLNENKISKLIIKNKDGLIVTRFQINAEKGLNIFNYDLAIEEKTKLELEKKYPELKINQAENKKYYLPEGKYSIELIYDKKVEKQIFHIIK